MHLAFYSFVLLLFLQVIYLCVSLCNYVGAAMCIMFGGPDFNLTVLHI